MPFTKMGDTLGRVSLTSRVKSSMSGMLCLSIYVLDAQLEKLNRLCINEPGVKCKDQEWGIVKGIVIKQIRYHSKTVTALNCVTGYQQDHMVVRGGVCDTNVLVCDRLDKKQEKTI